jgi:hypothetical protein
VTNPHESYEEASGTADDRLPRATLRAAARCDDRSETLQKFRCGFQNDTDRAYLPVRHEATYRLDDSTH